MTDKDQEDAFAEYFKYEQRTRPLKAFFEKGTRDLELKEQHFFARHFYWIKALICVWLGRNRGTYYDDAICVISYDEYQCYESINWRAVWVNRGVFKGWQVCCASDGT